LATICDLNEGRAAAIPSSSFRTSTSGPPCIDDEVAGALGLRLAQDAAATEPGVPDAATADGEWGSSASQCKPLAGIDEFTL
jgi:hypothetical protein